MRKEIGSEFWSAPVSVMSNTLFPENTKWFLSGRIALRYIIQDIKHKKTVRSVGIPSWCCESMIVPFIDEGIEVHFYPVVVDNGILKQGTSGTEVDILLVMDYFGLSTEERFDSYPGIVVRDITHSLFSNYADDADYYFGSMRKWCGVITGGFAWSKDKFTNKIQVFEADPAYISNRQNAMKQKAIYINGVIEQKDYLQVFSLSEKFLDELNEIQYGREEDIEIVKHIDTENIKKSRLQNAKILQEQLSDYLFLPSLKQEDCPLFIPILINKRDEVRRFLIGKEIYCPVHWPISKYHRLSKQTGFIYEHELSIICDQRYGVSDMERVVELVLKGISKC